MQLSIEKVDCKFAIGVQTKRELQKKGLKIKHKDAGLGIGTVYAVATEGKYAYLLNSVVGTDPYQMQVSKFQGSQWISNEVLGRVSDRTVLDGTYLLIDVNNKGQYIGACLYDNELKNIKDGSTFTGVNYYSWVYTNKGLRIGDPTNMTFQKYRYLDKEIVFLEVVSPKEYRDDSLDIRIDGVSIYNKAYGHYYYRDIVGSSILLCSFYSDPLNKNNYGKLDIYSIDTGKSISCSTGSLGMNKGLFANNLYLITILDQLYQVYEKGAPTNTGLTGKFYQLLDNTLIRSFDKKVYRATKDLEFELINSLPNNGNKITRLIPINTNYNLVQIDDGAWYSTLDFYEYRPLDYNLGYLLKKPQTGIYIIGDTLYDYDQDGVIAYSLL